MPMPVSCCFFLTAAKALVFDVAQSQAITRVICLFVLGGLIYLGGLFFKRNKEPLRLSW